MAMQTQIPRLLEERNKYGKNLRTNAVQSLSLFGEKSMSNPGPWMDCDLYARGPRLSSFL
jgi:hypothetical protein